MSNFKDIGSAMTSTTETSQSAVLAASSCQKTASPPMKNKQDQRADISGISKNELKKEILKELTTDFNKTVASFFKNDVQNALEGLVEARFLDYTNQSTQSVSIMDQTISKNDFELRISNLEDIVNPRVAEMETKVCNLINQKDNCIKELLLEIKKVKNENTVLSKENQKLLKTIKENKSCPHVNDCHELKQRMDEVENKTANHAVELDNQQQYGRQYILEFKEITYQGDQWYPENCIQVIKDFTNNYLNMKIETYDISTAHRQIIPNEKKRLGNNYIPPIYCKFVNRHVVHEILKRRNLLRNQRNIYGQQFTICQNLTLNRRLLWENVTEKLTTYKRKWVTFSGNIFVKKTHKSAPIKITCQQVLDNLIKNEKEIPKRLRQKVLLIAPEKQVQVPDSSRAVTAPASENEGNHQTAAQITTLVSEVSQPPSFPPLSNPSAPLSQTVRFPHPSLLCVQPRPPPPNGTHTEFTVPTYAHIANDLGYSFTPYERHQLKLGTRNSLLSPHSQKQYFNNGKPQKSRSCST